MACVVVSLLVVLLFLERILQPQQQLGLGLELLGTFPEDIKSTSFKKESQIQLRILTKEGRKIMNSRLNKSFEWS